MRPALIGGDSRKVSARKLSDEPPVMIPTLFSPTLASLPPGNRDVLWQMATVSVRSAVMRCFNSQ